MRLSSRFSRFSRALAPFALSVTVVAACGDGTSRAQDDADDPSALDASPTTPPEGAADGGKSVSTDAGDGGTVCVPSTATWNSLIPGPGQAGHDAELAANVARYDRLHEAVTTRATGLAGSVSFKADASMRQKVDQLLASPWDANDADPTDDLKQYTGLEPEALVTSWGMATGMYAGSEIAADAYRYGVLRDRGGSCNDVARARKMLQVSLDALHVVVDITGKPGSIARALMRKDLPGDGAAFPITPLFDGSGNPLPAEKNNGTWRADNSGGKYPTYTWVDSCSRDMLFGWTFGAAAAWEVIKDDPTFPAPTRDQLRADAKSVLDGLMKVRPGGKDLEIWDPDNRRTYHGNLHETSIDRNYVIKNGVASMMALGEVAGLVYVVDDAPAKAYLTSLLTTRGLPEATTQTMNVIALGGDSSNHSAFNMLFMTAWLADRYIPDAGARGVLKNPIRGVYAPLFGENPSSWGQSFFDLVAAHASGDGTAGKALASVDATALSRAVTTLRGFRPAPFYATTVENCDPNEVAAGTCVLNDGTTVVKLSNVKWGIVADKPLPMALRPPSNFFWRTSPFLVNGQGDANAVFPGSDLRMAYWLGRWVRAS